MKGLLFIRSNFVQCRYINNIQPVKLSYNVFGDPSTDRVRPPLVILHGLFGQKTNWNSVGKALQRRLQGVVYCVDLRNHGSSPKASSMTYADMAADVAEFIRDRRTENGFQKVNLLGHSMGGKTAMRLGVEPISASLINKLIIEDVSPKGYSTSHIKFREYVRAMQKVDLRKTRREILDDLEPAVPELAVRQFLITNLQPKGDGSFEWKCNMDVIDKYVEDVLGFSVPSGAFRGKTLFLYGAISGYVPDSDRPLIRCLFPQVEFESIANAGHWVHAEYPTEFINSMTAEAELESKLLCDLRVTELKHELEKRNLDKNGVKIILVERLVEALKAEGLDPLSHKFQIGSSSTSIPISSQSATTESSVSSPPHANTDVDDSAEPLDSTGEEGSLRVADTSGTDFIMDDDVAAENPTNGDAEPISGGSSPVEKEIASTCDTEEAEQEQEEELEDPLNEAEEKSDSTSPVPAAPSERSDSPSSKDKEDEQELSKRSVWVRGLSITVKAADLKNLFADHGKVLRAKIFTTKKQPGVDQHCYGYVTLVDLESLENCFNNLHKKPWRNMTLNIEKAIKFRLPPTSSPTEKPIVVETENDKVKSDSTSSPKDSKKGEDIKKDSVGKKNETRKESKHERITIDKSKKSIDNKPRRENEKDNKSRKDDRRPAKDNSSRRPARRPAPPRREPFRGSSSFRPGLSHRVSRPYGRNGTSTPTRHSATLPRSGSSSHPDPRDVMELRLRQDERRVRAREKELELEKERMRVEREKIEKEKLELQLKITIQQQALALASQGNRSDGFSSDPSRSRISSHSRLPDRDRERERDRERDRDRDRDRQRERDHHEREHRDREHRVRVDRPRDRDREQREKQLARAPRSQPDDRRRDRSGTTIRHPVTERDRSSVRPAVEFPSKTGTTGNFSARPYERENFSSANRESATSNSLGTSFFGGRDSFTSGSTATRDNNYSTSRTISGSNWSSSNNNHTYGNQWSNSNTAATTPAVNTWGAGGNNATGRNPPESGWSSYSSRSNMRFDYDKYRGF